MKREREVEHPRESPGNSSQELKKRVLSSLNIQDSVDTPVENMTPEEMQRKRRTRARVHRRTSTKAPQDSVEEYLERHRVEPQFKNTLKMLNAELDIDSLSSSRSDFPTIDEMISNKKFSDQYYSVHNNDESFYFLQKVRLSACLLERMRCASHCHAGIEPDLRRVWVSVDNVLYIWRYADEDPTEVEINAAEAKVCDKKCDERWSKSSVNWNCGNAFENGYSGQDAESSDFSEPKAFTKPEVIQSVIFAKPKEGVFSSNINYVCVIATKENVYVDAMMLDEQDQLFIFDTGLFTPLPGNPTALACMRNNGRIFCGCDDGSLCEITYTTEDTLLGFRSKCRRLDVSRTFASYIPLVKLFVTPDGIASITIDESRGLLYTLSAKSTLRCYSFRDRETLKLIGEKCDIGGIAAKQRDARRFTSLSTTQLARLAQLRRHADSPDVLTISPLRSGTRTCLVALCRDGTRLYFSVSPHRGLSCTHVRAPPAGIAITHPTATFVSSEFCVMSTRNEVQREGDGDDGEPEAAGGQGDTVHKFSKMSLPTSPREYHKFSDFLLIESPALTAEYTHLAQRGTAAQETTFAEMSAVYGMKHSIRCIKERQPPTPGSVLHSVLDSQHCTLPRELHALLKTSVMVLKERRPVDVLCGLLAERDNDRFTGFMNQYGTLQACEMCLEIATAPAGYSCFVRRITDDVKNAAREKFFGAFDDPKAPGSCVLRALCLRVARILANLWNRPVFTTRRCGALEVCLNERLAASAAASLDAVREFVTANQFLFIDDVGDTPVVGIACDGILKLVSTAVDVLRLVRFFDDRVDLHAVSAHLPPGTRLDGEAFKEFVVTLRGKEALRLVVDAIIEDVVLHENGRGLDVYKEVAAFATLFPLEEANRFHGMEDLCKAAKASAAVAQSCLRSSLRAFMRAPCVPLAAVCEAYRRHGFFAGIVVLCCSQAAKRDPANAAYDALAEASRNPENTLVLNYRYAAYAPALDTIEWLWQAQHSADECRLAGMSQQTAGEAFSSVLAAVAASEDLLFHRYVYEKLLDLAPASLVNLRTPFVEDFLCEQAPLLLVANLKAQRNFGKAAAVLHRIARGEVVADGELTLFKRLEYLAECRNLVRVAFGDPQQSQLPALSAVKKSVCDDFSLVQLQIRVVSRLRSLVQTVLRDRPANAEARIAELERGITDFRRVFTTCQQFGLYDVCLHVLRALGECDPAVAKQLWERTVFSPLVADSAALSCRVVETIISLAPDDVLCPLPTVFTLLEVYRVRSGAAVPVEYAPSTLRLANLSADEIVLVMAQALIDPEQVGGECDVDVMLTAMLESFLNFVQRTANLEDEARKAVQTVLVKYKDSVKQEDYDSLLAKLSLTQNV